MVPVLLILAATAAAPSPENGVERVWQGGSSLILLGRGQGGCPEGEKMALFASPKGKVAGCWFEKDERVWIWWQDGDSSAVPAKAFHKPIES